MEILEEGFKINLMINCIVPATPNFALFLSSMARLQIKEEANLLASGEVGDWIMELRR